ncbi:uncharacterized protein LOC131800648 [Musca domestica]|uniref:Uncharacterized protein LOC131800648 n=1 Tax=Musca domestica TaxID=7370 RepID=A0ABM3UKX2_MUSDO|nr:uncharacterized protein LOC131800648 [Musca domestica]
MSLFNEDELTAPAWINQDFIKMVLAKYENVADVEIINYDMSPASMKGDHYASIMFRCKVEYRLGDNIVKRSLIMKTLPVEEDSKKREFLMDSKLFETEIKMYSETLPKFEKILAECGEPTKLSAGLFYHALQPHKILIMEDLCELGFNTLRGRYLTEDELKVVYTKLAKLHAVSYMLGQGEEHESVAQYQDGFMSISLPMMKDMMSYGMKHFLDVLESRDEFAIYVDKVKVIFNELEEACKDLFNAYKTNGNKGDIFVLNHGDFHMRNMMFKLNSEESVEDVMMVDYQISCYAPSCIDLIYSQFMLMSPELRMRRHSLIRFYFTEFLRILKKLDFEGKLPKYSQFQQSTLKYRHFVMYCMGVLLPLVLGFLAKPAEELKEIDTTKLPENPDMNAYLYFSPEVFEEIRNFMPVLLNEGYLD